MLFPSHLDITDISGPKLIKNVPVQMSLLFDGAFKKFLINFKLDHRYFII